ncbi:DUF4123 domain-containing protein [Marinobacter sp. NFXS9]|uniref:DUF4123 domain-containing protein n=1 Tax=Marinobacter sp. NFXS9 TaxID=2818433 RepID=UPI0032DEF7B8
MTWPFHDHAPAYAIIDIALPQLREQWYARAGSPSSVPLYLDTPLAHLTDVSPVLTEIDADSPFLPWVAEHRPDLNWGVLFCSTANLNDIAAHLRKTLTVIDTDDDEILLRFYDPDVLPLFWQALSPGEQQLFSGPVTTWAARRTGSIDDLWQGDPPKEPGQTDWANLEAPWLTLTDRHQAALQPLYHRHLRQALLVKLQKTMAWRIMHLSPGFLESRIDEALHALYPWDAMPDTDIALAFCRLCMEQCSHFHQSPRAQTSLRQSPLTDALAALQGDIAQQPEHYTPFHDPAWMPAFDESALTAKRRANRWSNQG